MDIQARLLHDDSLISLSGEPLVVAVSGGPDSLCLLHALVQLRDRLGILLHVATLDHGLRGVASQADADFVEATAHQWQLPVHREYRDVKAIGAEYGLGTEEAARQVRYTFLAAIARQVGARAIALGHNADDQAETILLHLLRGTGLAGLRGMQATTPLSRHHLLPGYEVTPAELQLLRPLLGVPRADIEQYCSDYGLEPRQDATNQETAYLRNRLRHEVMPLLASINPNIRGLLARTGQTLADDYQLLQQLVAVELSIATRQASDEAITLDLAYFRQPGMSRSLRRGLIREALRSLAPEQQDVGFIPVEQALEVALHGATGSQSTLPGNILLRVDYDTITLHRPDPEPQYPAWPRLAPGTTVAVTVPGQTILPDTAWILETRWLETGEKPEEFQGQPFTVTLAVAETDKLALRTRQPGDRVAPLGLGGHTQKLSDVFINAKVPALLRDQLPLLTVNSELAWIVLGSTSKIAHNYAVTSETSTILLVRWVLQSSV